MKLYEWNGLTLLPERAIWRADTHTLFVADVHLGKAAHFRALGVPAPAGATRENLARLDALIDALGARHLVVLGDLFHARAALRGPTFDDLAAWRARRAALAVTLVEGNHDRAAGGAPAALGFTCVAEPYDLDGLVCRHAPPEADDPQGRPVLAGHWHPAARLRGPGRDSLRLPCFLLWPRRLVAPAFGEFTGGATFEADGECALLATAGDRLVHVPTRATCRASR